MSDRFSSRGLRWAALRFGFFLGVAGLALLLLGVTGQERLEVGGLTLETTNTGLVVVALGVAIVLAWIKSTSKSAPEALTPEQMDTILDNAVRTGEEVGCDRAGGEG